MSKSIRESSDERGIELGSNLSWPHIIAGLGLLVVPLAIGIFVLIGSATREEPTKQDRVAASVPSAEPANTVTMLAFQRSTPARPELLPEPRVFEELLAVLPRERELLRRPLVPKPALVAAPPIAVAAATPSASEAPRPVAPMQETNFKRRFGTYEDELRSRLVNDAAEVDIDKEKDTTKKLLTKKFDPKEPVDRGIRQIIAQRSDLAGLPIRDADKCQTTSAEAKVLQKLSAEMRRGFPRSRTRRASESSFGESNHRDADLVAFVGKDLKLKEWREEPGARMLVQMFQHERPSVRLQMIKSLTEIKGAVASAGLAQRAVFDLNPDVRQAAVEALSKRPNAEYRHVILDALRYPWPPIADHAAEAIVAMRKVDSFPELAGMLDLPDPCAPVQNADKKLVAAELVRINHLGNCVLCHAPVTGKDDLIRGLVPTRGEPLPEVYYESRSGNFVRADVTYLKQDFSVTNYVRDPNNKWPNEQRFDYLVRRRQLTADEVKKWQAENKEATSYPQREAILWALNEIATGAAGGR
jgi:hypothetical protein